MIKNKKEGAERWGARAFTGKPTPAIISLGRSNETSKA